MGLDSTFWLTLFSVFLLGKSCNLNEYFDGTSCITCDISCASCSGPSAQECTTCPSSQKFTKYTSTTGTCTSECPIYYYNISMDCYLKEVLSYSLFYGDNPTEYRVKFSQSIAAYYVDISLSMGTAIRSQGHTTLIMNTPVLLGTDTISLRFDFQRNILANDILIFGSDQKEDDDTVSYRLTTPFSAITMVEYYMYTESAQQAIEALSIVGQVKTTSNEVFSQISALALTGVHSTRSKLIQSTINSFAYMNIDFPPSFSQFMMSNSRKGVKLTRLLEEGEDMNLDDLPIEVQEVTNADKYTSDQNFFENLSPILISLSAGLIMIPVLDFLLYLCTKTNKKENTWYFKLIRKGSVSFRWSYLLNQYMSGYQELSFFSFFEVYSVLIRGRSSKNLPFAFIGIVLVLSGLIGVFFLIRSVYRNLKDYNQEAKKLESKTHSYLERRRVLHEAYRHEHLIQLFYPLALMLRAILSSLIIIFLFKFTIVQLAFFNASSLFVMIYLIKYKPLQEKSQLALTLAYEMLLFIVLLIVTALHIYNKSGGDDMTLRSALGFVLIIAIDGLLVLNLIGFCLEIWEYIDIVVQKLKNLRRKKRAITPIPIVHYDKPLEEIGLTHEGEDTEKNSRLTRPSMLKIQQNSSFPFDEKSKLSVKQIPESPNTTVSPSYRQQIAEEDGEYSPNKGNKRVSKVKQVSPSNSSELQPIIEDLSVQVKEHKKERESLRKREMSQRLGNNEVRAS